ncbi:Protein arginine N-methyltransferase [Mycena chlorophos]|uniref:Protein arginine N-methyltransferase n=1 Tax=Mycena chlorophos TaxID=658473 RepID=A0A8H6WJ69_MYCCL|nr:Protein arginine N-methyltransferase [Mycena chlorophos]
MTTSLGSLLTLFEIASTAPTKDAPTPVLELSSQARAKGYDLVCLPLTTDAWKKRWTEMCLLPPGADLAADLAAEKLAEAWRTKPTFLLNEVTVTQLDEADGATAIVSEWLELDAADDWVRHDTEIALNQELSYASYLNIHSAILPPPRNREHVSSYARTVNACLKAHPYMHLSIRLPIYSPTVLNSPLSTSPSPPLLRSPSPVPATPRLVISDERSADAPPTNLDATWEMWDVIRSICDYNTRLTLTLDLTPPLPVNSGFLAKWKAEAIRYLFLPASTFIANTKGYPVLPKGTQSFIRESMSASSLRNHHPVIVLAGANQNLHARGGELAYSQYLRHLHKTSAAFQAANTSGTVENFAQGYQDYLQAPLQPLMDNLQSVTYQTFEQDPVKYRNYEEAIYHALVDWTGEDKLTLCVAGAGRGPLVSRALSAIERSGREAHVYAVEKNPNAYITLQGRKETEWGDQVTLLFGDMRHIEVPEKADILISELLGSFGDNELSPECLDGAMRFLKSEGISIPASYTAHLAPLSSSKLFNEARVGKDEKNLETPYVVMFQAVNILSGDGSSTNGRCGPQIQECWEFEHPRRDAVLNERGLPLTNSHNARSAKLNFFIPHAGVLHGLAGYFEAVLYGNIGLSIHPHRKERISKDMLSWFPLFFPFKEPLYLPSNSELHVSIWRLTNQRQVWYEWHAEAFLNIVGEPSPETEVPLPSPRSAMSSSFFSSPPRNTPSPLIDASFTNDAFSFGLDRRVSTSWSVEPPAERLIKIGHTSLHNPGGRSSWIGL